MTCAECGSTLNPNISKCRECGWEKHQVSQRGGEIISLYGKIPSNHSAFIVWIDRCKWKVGTKRCSMGAATSTGHCAFHRDCLSDPDMAEKKMLFLEWLGGELNYYGEEMAKKFPDQTWGVDSPESLWSKVSGFDPHSQRREKALFSQSTVGVGG